MTYYATNDHAEPQAAGAAGPYDREPFRPQFLETESLPNVPVTGLNRCDTIGPARAPSADRPQLAVELDRLWQLAEIAQENRNLVGSLLERLTPVLRPLPRNGQTCGGDQSQVKHEEILMPLAANLREFEERVASRLHESNAVLRWLLDALGV